MNSSLIDSFGRRINYLRLSLTDRCDFRCVYCMEEQTTFLPREQLLTLEEHLLLVQAFSELGVNKVRITGGEPLVRRNMLWLVQQIGQLNLADFAITTNGSQLTRFALLLAQAGVTRINISLDTLDPILFHAMTRHGELATVLAGIEAACQAGFRRLRINAVLLRGRNAPEAVSLVEYALQRGMDIAFIEEMPVGNSSDHDRAALYYSNEEAYQVISSHFPLVATAPSLTGPARYWQIVGSNTRVGFISPHSHNFCSDCNRVRVTTEGRLLLCLGQEQSVDLRQILRSYPGDVTRLQQTIVTALAQKPQGHSFTLGGPVIIQRQMNRTGG